MEALDIYFYDLGKFLLPEFLDMIVPGGREDILGIKAFRDQFDNGSLVLDLRMAYNITPETKFSLL